MYTPIGNFDPKKGQHGEGYYSERHTFIDYRGDLRISKLSYLGFNNTIITASHSVLGGQFDPHLAIKHVYIDDYAWVTSGCILYNCHIMHHGIVSIGSVVSNMIVEPYHVVAGNPAVVIAIWDGKRWTRPQPEPLEDYDIQRLPPFLYTLE